jgi:hypothetical protein
LEHDDFFAKLIDDQSNITHKNRKNSNPMKADESPEAVTVFLQNLPDAVSKLRNRLQRNYNQAYPGLPDLIRIVLDQEEAKAWNLSPFPHLLLPDLVEAHIAQLGLKPADATHDNIWAPLIDAEPAVAATC